VKVALRREEGTRYEKRGTAISRRPGFQLGLIVLMTTYVGVFTLAQQRPPLTDAVAELSSHGPLGDIQDSSISCWDSSISCWS
jgi:hypothetical protein